MSEKDKQKKKDVIDYLTEATFATEGLSPGQTPLRITSEKMRNWDTIQGVKIDKKAKKPKGRENFFFVAPDDVEKVIRRQWERYIKAPEDFGLTKESTLEDVIKVFDQQHPENKIKTLQNLGVDTKQRLKDINLSKRSDNVVIPSALVTLLGITIGDLLPGDELLVGLVIGGLSLFTVYQMMRSGQTEKLRQMIDDIKREAPLAVHKLLSLPKKAKEKLLQQFAPSPEEKKLEGFPKEEVQKPDIGGIPAKKESTEPLVFPEEKLVVGKDVFPTPEGFTTTPPLIPLPTETEKRGKKVSIGEEVIPIKTADTALLKAEAKPIFSDEKITEAHIRSLERDIGALESHIRSLELAKINLIKRGQSAKAIDRKLNQLKRKYIWLDSKIADALISKIDLSDKKKERADFKVEELLAVNRLNARQIASIEKRALRQGRTEAIQQFREKIKATNYTKKLINDIKGINEKKLRPEFAKVIREVKSAVDFSKPTQKTLRKLWSRVEFLSRFPEADIPDYALEELDRLHKTPLRNLTLQQLEALHATVLSAVHQNKIKNSLIFDRKLKDINTAIEEAVENLERHKTSRKQDIDTRIVENKMSALKNIFTLQHWNPELVCNILDKKITDERLDPLGETHGVITRILFDNIDKGVNTSLSYRQQKEAQWSKWLKGANISIENWSEWFNADPKKVDFIKVFLPDGRTITMTKAERISFYMHSLNAKNRAHLLNGGWAFVKNPTKIYQLDEEDLQVIIDSTTQEERAVAKALKDIVYDPQYEDINNVFIRLKGYSLGKEENYLRIRVAGVSLPKETKELHKRISKIALEEMGMLKERRNANNPILIEDIFKATYDSIRNAATFIGLALPIRDAKMLLYSGRFESTLRQTYGKEWHAYLDRYLEDVVGYTLQLDDVEKIVASVRDRLTVALLGGNPFIWLYQPVSYLQGTTEISEKYLRRAVKILATPELIEKWAARSPELAERFKIGFSRDTAAVGYIGEVRRFWIGKSGFAAKLMRGVRNFDTKTIIRICEAAEMEQYDMGFRGEELAKRATARAMGIIRKTQPTFHAKDRSAISRTRNPVLRFITMFMSQRNKNYIIQRRAIEKYSLSPKDPKDKARLIWALLCSSIVQHQLVRGIKLLRRVLLRKGKPLRKEKAMTIFVRDWLGAVVGNLYGGPTLVNSLASKIEKGSFAGYDMDTPLSQLSDSGVDAVSEILRSLRQLINNDVYKSGKYKHQLKWKVSLKRGLDKVASVILSLRGIPYVTLRDAVQAMLGWTVDYETEQIRRRSLHKRPASKIFNFSQRR